METLLKFIKHHQKSEIITKNLPKPLPAHHLSSNRSSPRFKPHLLLVAAFAVKIQGVVETFEGSQARK